MLAVEEVFREEGIPVVHRIRPAPPIGNGFGWYVIATLVGMTLRDFSTPATESYVVATPLLSVERAATLEAAQAVRNARYTSQVEELARRLGELPGGNVLFMSHAPSAEDQVPISAEPLATESNADTMPGSAGRYMSITRVGVHRGVAQHVLKRIPSDAS